MTRLPERPEAAGRPAARPGGPRPARLRLCAAVLAAGVSGHGLAAATPAGGASEGAVAATGAATSAAPGAMAGAADLDAVRARLEAARAGLEAARGGDGRLRALGEAVRAQEAALAAYRQGLRDMARRADGLAAGIEERRARLGETLSMLQALSSAPRSALFAFPGGPLDAARAATLLAAVTPELESRRIALAAELDRLHAVRVEQEIARVGASDALAALQALRAETAEALDERRRTLPAPDRLAAEAERLGQSATGLGRLSELLVEALGGAPAGAGFAAARGRLPLPVGGTVAAGYGAPDPWGAAGFGLTLAAPAHAEVSAPADATVRFAGRLAGYGQVAVLEPAPGWLLVLAGLGTLDRRTGETVLRGERIGDLGGALPGRDEIFLDADGEAAQIEAGELYIELRQEGVPIDPAPWFDANGT